MTLMAALFTVLPRPPFVLIVHFASEQRLVAKVSTSSPGFYIVWRIYCLSALWPVRDWEKFFCQSKTGATTGLDPVTLLKMKLLWNF